MLTTKTVIYKGLQPVYNLTNPGNERFPKDVPVTIDSRLMHYLPAEDFAVYDSTKHKVAKNIQPILFKLPINLTEILCNVRSLCKLREFYPATPITVLAKADYKMLFPGLENVTFVESYKVEPLKWFAEYNSRIYKDSPIFNGGALFVHTREFCYLQHHKMMYGDDPKMPTLLKMRNVPQFLTIINNGSSMASVWTDLADFLIKQQWDYPIQVIDKGLPLDKAIDMLSRSKYVICTGDSEYAMLTAYLGRPLFVFVPDINSVFIHQLNFFNNLKANSVKYSPFLYHKEPEIIYTKLVTLIQTILNEQPIPVEDEKKMPIKIENPRRQNRGGRTR